MAQYRIHQYGQSQYGRFADTRPGTGGSSQNWQLVKSRMGVNVNGQTFWLYQHRPVSFQGQAQTLRLTTNLDERLYLQQVTSAGRYSRVRLASPGFPPVESRLIETKGVIN